MEMRSVVMLGLPGTWGMLACGLITAGAGVAHEQCPL